MYSRLYLKNKTVIYLFSKKVSIIQEKTHLLHLTKNRHTCFDIVLTIINDNIPVCIMVTSQTKLYHSE